MTTRVWTGAADATTFATAGNWSPSGAPSNGDTLIYRDTNHTITGAATGLSSITLQVTPGFTGQLGSSTTYLDLDCTLVEYASGGFQSFLTGTWTDLRLTGGSSSNSFLDLKGSADTTITNITSSRLNGTLIINSSAAVTNITMTGSNNGVIDIKSGVSGLTKITASSGHVKLASNCTTVDVLGGQLTTSDSAAITTMEVDGGGTVEHNTSGTLTTLELYEGTFNTRQNESTSYTVTNATVYTSGRLFIDSPINNGVFTNPVLFLGGQSRFPLGATVTFS